VCESCGFPHNNWPNPSSFLVKAQSSTVTVYYNHTQSAAGLISRQSSFKDSKYSMKQQHNHQICTTPSRKIRAIAGLCKKVHATKIPDYGSR
jgi:hypothetical protein